MIILAIGAAVAIGRLGIAICFVWQVHRSSIRIDDLAARALLQDFAVRSGVRQMIELREAAQLATAATYGVLRAVVILPRNWRDWSDEELRAVLAHEVAHVRRGDYWQRLVAECISAVYYFHPLVRMAVCRLQADQEFAADCVASNLGVTNGSYMRGLVRLALRYDEMAQDGPGWSNVSIMPNSSDYLTRRLEMLRSRDRSASNRSTKIVSLIAIGSVVVAAAVAAICVRLPAQALSGADAKKAADSSATKKSTESNVVSGAFNRTAFDPIVLPGAEQGAFLIRVGEIVRHPQLRASLGAINENLTDTVRLITRQKDAVIDLQQIEWIAGQFQLTIKPYHGRPGAAPKPGAPTAAMMFGSHSIVLRMAHARDWQGLALRHLKGATLETKDGTPFVQCPKWGWVGPIGLRLEFPDDRTIIVFNGKSQGALSKVAKSRQIDHPGQRPYAWLDAWKAVDRGLVTIVADQSKSGWKNLPAANRVEECPAELSPLGDAVQYYAAGFDWSDRGDQAGIRIRGTCVNQADVKDVQLAAALLQNRWPELFIGKK